jgi:predicted O-linked N-acetylglucosamine transferase (SPINDLY family)
MNTSADGRARDLYRAGRFEDALTSLDSALALSPDRAELWNNRGTVLAALGRLDEACVSFGRALNLRPDLTSAFGNRANSLLALGRHEDAARDYERVLAVHPDMPYARGNFLHCRLQSCDWRDFDAERAQLLAEVRAGKRAASPLAWTVILQSPEDQLHAARILTADKYPSMPPLWRGERYRHDRIRIAYVSADFSAHATATLMAGVFEHHDRTLFEPIAISFGANDRSPMRGRLENSFARFIDVTSQSDAEIAALMRETEVDIAVDLKGYTANARPSIFARKPAPVQVSYLGFPGTMGAEFIDYIIADPIVIPETAEAFYSEEIVRLPDSYQANDAKRPIAPAAPTRNEAGLPESGAVFCCFNNAYKILPELFDIWMRLLRNVEGSVLWLLDGNPSAASNLGREAEQRGVTASRLVFAPRLPPDEHLARHRLADLFLDTLPYNAHTTASDSLWAGLPVLTCTGDTFAGRVAASLLHAARLPELVTKSLAAYEALALDLARDPKTLASIKAKLVRNRDICPLFDTARFTRHLEAAYVAMHERASRGQPPTSIAIPPIAARDPG